MSGLRTGSPEAYVGRASCGCSVAVTVNMLDHPKDVAKDVAEWIRDGLSIEGHTIEEVRAMSWGCKCKSDQTALEL